MRNKIIYVQKWYINLLFQYFNIYSTLYSRNEILFR